MGYRQRSLGQQQQIPSSIRLGLNERGGRPLSFSGEVFREIHVYGLGENWVFCIVGVIGLAYGIIWLRISIPFRGAFFNKGVFLLPPSVRLGVGTSSAAGLSSVCMGSVQRSMFRSFDMGYKVVNVKRNCTGIWMGVMGMYSCFSAGASAINIIVKGINRVHRECLSAGLIDHLFHIRMNGYPRNKTRLAVCISPQLSLSA